MFGIMVEGFFKNIFLFENILFFKIFLLILTD